MPLDAVLERISGLRQRSSRRYVPFARRQDNDDIACLDPEAPEHIVIVHDFASEAHELRNAYSSFWEWFRTAIEDMIFFE